MGVKGIRQPHQSTGDNKERLDTGSIPVTSTKKGGL